MYYIYPQDGRFYVSNGKMQPPTGFYESLFWAVVYCLLYKVEYKILDCVVVSGRDEEI